MFTLAVQAEKLHHKPYIPAIEVPNVRKGFVSDAKFEAVLPHLLEDIQPLIQFLWRLAKN
jgi:hypothetical protein